MGINALLKIIKESIKEIPSLKYAFGVLALVSIVAIVASLQLDYRIAIFGVLFVLLMSTVVLIFSKLSRLDGGHFRTPAIFFLWFSLAVSIVLPTLLISSIFFKYPLDLSFYLTHNNNPIEAPVELDKDNKESIHFTDFKPIEISLPDHGKIEFIERWNNLLIAGFSSPNQIIIAEDPELTISQQISLNGSPIHIELDDRYAYVATKYPSGIHKIDLLSKKTIQSFLLPHDKNFFPKLVATIDGQLPTEIQSMALFDTQIWILASDNNNAVLYILDLQNGNYSVPKYFDEEIAFSARGWRLERIAQKIFAIETDSIPSGLHILENDKYITFGGHDYDLISSATNIWASSSNSLSFIDPENQLIGVNITLNSIVPLALYGNLGETGAQNWIDPIVKIDGDITYIAVNESTIPNQKILWSTLISFENKNKNEIGMFIDSKIIDIAIFRNRIYSIVENSNKNRRLTYVPSHTMKNG